MQVKIFKAKDPNNLEQQLNEFINTNIVEIVSAQVLPETFEYKYVVLMLYKNYKELN